ncbi:MAG: BMP family ABC transporter substrate-binding protein [Acidimicrobiales bacterium]
MTFDLLSRRSVVQRPAACGLDAAVANIGVAFTEITLVDESARATDLQRQAENSALVVGVGFSFRDGGDRSRRRNPDVNFAIIDDAMLDFDTGEPVGDNVAGLVFAEEQGSFLVGAAAALKSTSGKIGFLGGVSGIGLIEKFEAGYIAGAKAVNPDIEVISEYISAFPDFAGFESPDQGKETAAPMYDEGADIVYAAAGSSGSGMFQAAAEYSAENDTKVCGASGRLRPVPHRRRQRAGVRPHVDAEACRRGRVQDHRGAGQRASHRRGRHLRSRRRGRGLLHLRRVCRRHDQLEDFKAKIISGEIEVPTDPANA